MTPADFFFLSVASCTIVLTLLAIGALVAVIMVARTVQKKLAAIRIPERFAVVSPWALVMQDVVREGISWWKDHYGSRPGGGHGPGPGHGPGQGPGHGPGGPGEAR